MEQTKPITLYELDGCPYCAKVIDTLEKLGIEYNSIEVPPSHNKRTEVQELTGGETGVPVIVDPNTDEFEWLNESDDIVAYLNRIYGDKN